jgi:hypothetical protein
VPATPSQLRRPIIVNHTVDFGDEVTVKFVFDRNKITDAWMQTWVRLESEPDASGKLNEMLADLVVQWDVVNEDGSPYPMNAEAMGTLFSLPDKGRIFQELVRASVPSDAEGKASSAPTSIPSSDSTLPQAPSPNGTAASPSPELSAVASPT